MERSLIVRALMPLPFVALPAVRLSQGMLRWDYVAFLVVPFVLANSARTRRLFVGLYPLGLVAVLYDAMKMVKSVGVTPERVHLCDLRAAEARFFGAGGSTIHDWLQPRAIPALDVLFAVPYAIFIFVCIGFAVWLWLRDERAMRTFGWSFFVVNVAGFATYHLYPAAPPWYFHAHGCTVDLAASASTGANLARVDTWIGIPYFHGMYARASDVYGAMPSLHVAYPLLIVLVGWPLFGPIRRALAILFLVSMCLAAVYLDHHWVLDVLIGLVYAVVTFAIVDPKFRERLARALALWFGCGRVPLAPGTAGTLGAIPLYLLVRPHGRWAVALTAIVLVAIGVWAADRFARRTGQHDPQCVVIDEVAGVHVAWLGAPHTTTGLVAGFVLFRVLDQVKPWPARWAERRLRGGWGIVFDDVLAGAWAAIALAAFSA